MDRFSNFTRRTFLAGSSSAIAGANGLWSNAEGTAQERDRSIGAARAVLVRLLGERADDFDLSWIPAEARHPVYVLSASRGHVRISGSSAVALCQGAYRYLRDACHSMVTWSGRHLDLPSKFPDQDERKVVCPYEFVQYLNVCTFGYSTAFWNWERWERELDWMALHGITMPLAMEGQEAIWQRVWSQLGLTQAELDRFSTGPGHLPWHRLGNIDAFDGPLPQTWIEAKRRLQRQILDRMRELGMTPIVPAFSGFVPQAFKRIHPDASTFVELWLEQMPRASKTLILDPNEAALYKEIGGRFIREYKREFGPAEYYLADTFNELKVPVRGDHRYDDLARFARTVFDGILAGDPQGKWVMQGWLFRNDPKFWDDASIERFLSGVPRDRMVILDYSNDSNAQNRDVDPTAGNEWKDHHAFFGQPWVNGLLHTFGGNNNVKGNLRLIASQPAEVLASPGHGNLVGFGIDPEGIESNEVVYELMTDIGWSGTRIRPEAWIQDYCLARYGACPPAMREAWSRLLDSAYAWHPFYTTKHAWQSRPSLEPSAQGVECGPVFRQAVEQFLSCSGQLRVSTLYLNDLTELVAQSAGGSVDEHLAEACREHRNGQSILCAQKVRESLDMLLRIDGVMNLRPDRRLETWTQAARSWGAGDDERAYYDANARRLITIWGWTHLSDYASRVWAGLIRDYYAARWRAFFDALQGNKPFSTDVWEENWLSAPYRPTRPAPVDDLVAEARRMLDTCRAWT